MRVYSTPRNIWRAVYPALIYFGLHSLTTFIAGIAYGVMFALNGSLEAADAQARLMQAITDNTMVFMLFGNALCFAVFLPIWLKIENRLTPYKLEKTGKLAVGVFTK